MKPSDDLFHLIKSLTKSEKRHFKLSASLQKGEKQYLRLFDAIDAQAAYDEEALRRLFAGERFLRQLNVAKKYLYDLILRNLRTYQLDTTANARAKDLITSAALLYERGLTAQALRLIEKAIRIARDHEDRFSLLEALYWQGRLDPTMLRSESGLQENFSQLFETIDSIRESFTHERALFMLRLALRDEVPRSQREQEEADRWLGELWPSGGEYPKSLDARRWLHTAHYLRAVGAADFHTALDHIRIVVELFESRPEYLRENLKVYLTALHNLAASNRMMCDYDALQETIRRMQSAVDSYALAGGAERVRLQSDFFVSSHIHRLKELNRMGDFERARELVDDIEAGLRRYREHIDPEMKLGFFAALSTMYFGLENYDRALDYNNRILADPEPQLRRYRYYQARLFNLMIHVELHHHDLVEHLIRSVYRYLSSRGANNRFEEIVLLFFRRLLRTRTQSEVRAIAEETLRELMPLRMDQGGLNGIDYPGFTTWLRRYVEGRSISEIMREEYHRSREFIRDAGDRHREAGVL